MLRDTFLNRDSVVSTLVLRSSSMLVVSEFGSLVNNSHAVLVDLRPDQPRLRRETCQSARDHTERIILSAHEQLNVSKGRF
jgi:hypothetical protein